MIKGVELTENK